VVCKSGCQGGVVRFVVGALGGAVWVGVRVSSLSGYLLVAEVSGEDGEGAGARGMMQNHTCDGYWPS
jgi:hypothetical protein